MNQNIKIQVIRADDFRQVYAIGAMGGHSPYDFRIAFYNDTPQSFAADNTIERRVDTEIILSPAAAKELSIWLNQHLEDYEKMFGPITTADTAMKLPKKQQAEPTQIQGYM